MKTFYFLQINTYLRLFNRCEISRADARHWSELQMQRIAKSLYAAKSRREFDEVCRLYGI